MSEKIAPQFTCDTFGTLAPSMSRFFVDTPRAIDHYFADFYASVYDQLFIKEYLRENGLIQPYLCAKKGLLFSKSSASQKVLQNEVRVNRAE